MLAGLGADGEGHNVTQKVTPRPGQGHGPHAPLSGSSLVEPVARTLEADLRRSGGGLVASVFGHWAFGAFEPG